MQQINLYLPEYRPNREPLRTHHMLWGLLAFFVLLCLASVLGAMGNTQAAKEMEARRSEVQHLEQQLAQFSRQAPPDQSEQLNLRIRELEDEVQRRRDIARAINAEAPGQQSGFSAQLTSMARVSSEQLSLDIFSLQNGGRFVELGGFARTAEEVPAYLQRLLSEASFQHTGFGVIKLEIPDNASRVRFDIRKAPTPATNSNQRNGGAR